VSNLPAENTHSHAHGAQTDAQRPRSTSGPTTSCSRSSLRHGPFRSCGWRVPGRRPVRWGP
jgi:hypothetical protein